MLGESDSDKAGGVAESVTTHCNRLLLRWFGKGLVMPIVFSMRETAKSLKNKQQCN